jgi:hypothetical protein
VTRKDRFRKDSPGCDSECVPVDYLAHHEADRKLRAHLGVCTEEELLDALFFTAGSIRSKRHIKHPLDGGSVKVS